jgi:hypothetical protein
MPEITSVTLSFVSQTASEARLKAHWTMTFDEKDIAAHQVYNWELFLENDVPNDLEWRRRRIARGSVAAAQGTVEIERTRDVDRNFLNEDYLVVGLGDTTDEWRAEVILTPWQPPAETKRASALLRREFAP